MNIGRDHLATPVLGVLLALFIAGAPSVAEKSDEGDRDAEKHDKDGKHEKYEDDDKDEEEKDEPPPKLTDHQIALFLEIIDQWKPELAEHLKELREKNPKRLRKKLHEHRGRVHHVIEEKRDDPVGFDLYVRAARLQRRSRELVAKLEKAPPEKAKRHEKELRKTAAKYFEVRQKIRQHRLDRLQDKIERLRKKLKQREDRREQLIREHIEKLRKQSEGEKTDAGEAKNGESGT